MADTPPQGEPLPTSAGTKHNERPDRVAQKWLMRKLQDQSAPIDRARREWEAAFDAVRHPIFIHDRDSGLTEQQAPEAT